jgi:PAS domain S-box-containing protein
MNFFSLGKESITAFFIMGILVLISSSIVAYLNSQDQLDSNDYIADVYKRIGMIDKISTLISDAEASRRGYQISGDAQYVSNIDNSRANIDSLLKSLRLGLRENARQLQRIDTLFMLINERFDQFKQLIYIQNSKGTNPKLLKPIFDKGKILNSDINALTGRMKQEENATINVKHELGDRSFRFTFYTITGGVIVCIIIFVSVFVVLRKNTMMTGGEDEEITKEELEKIVRDRTAELSQINNKLNSKITELQIKDEDLRRSEQYYKMLFDQAFDAIMIINPDDEKVLDVNKRACEIYGFNREEFIGLSLKSISKNVIMGEENVKKTLEKGFFHNFQTVHYNKSKSEMLIEINASVVKYDGKNAILSINRDITERVLMIH